MTSRDLRVYWGFLCAAALSLATTVLLFQPWLTAQGPNGRILADAFGRTQGTTDANTADTWGEGAYPAHISGGWGILTAAAAITTIFAVGMYLRDGSPSLALLVLGSSAGQALSVFCTLLYLNGKSQAFKTLVETSGTGGLRDLLSGNGTSNIREVASVSLGAAAMLGGITALGCVLIVLTSIMPIRGNGQAATGLPADPGPDAPAQPTPTPESTHSARALNASDADRRAAVPAPRPDTRPHAEARLDGMIVRLPFAPSTARTDSPLFAGSAAER
ncbi:hypothetical protein [Nocardia wallacei]|uniref:hypothetical protein n=1 Tax=Nocardia wallacei TaxID=480035 RepID=UPI0024590D01|nr:hypothetical protein [Nocardia wallacei]